MKLLNIFSFLYKKLAWIPLVTLANIATILFTWYTFTHDDHTDEIAAYLSDIGRQNAFLTKESVPKKFENDPFIVSIDTIQDGIMILRGCISAVDYNVEEMDYRQSRIEINKYRNILHRIGIILNIYDNLDKRHRDILLSSMYLTAISDVFPLASTSEKKIDQIEDYKNLIREGWLQEYLESLDRISVRLFKQINLVKKEYIKKRANKLMKQREPDQDARRQLQAE